MGGGEQAQKGLSQLRIWMMNADGTRTRKLTVDPQYLDEYPLRSPDWRYIFFTRMDQLGEAGVWSINVNNGALQKIVDRIIGLRDLQPEPALFPSRGATTGSGITATPGGANLSPGTGE